MNRPSEEDGMSLLPDRLQIQIPHDRQSAQYRTCLLNRADRLAGQMRERNIGSAALWFSDTDLAACALVACSRAGVRAVLPANISASSVADAESTTDIWIADMPVAGAGIDRLSVPEADDTNAQADGWFVADAHIVLCTSGSGGAAKTVVKTWRQMWAEADVLAQEPWVAGASHIWGSVSTQHLYGLTFRIMLPLYAGIPFLPEQTVYPEQVLAYAARYPGSLAVLSPTLLQALVCAPGDKSVLRNIRIVSAGGMLPPDTAEAVGKLANRPVCEIYGSTETGVIARRQAPDSWHFFEPVGRTSTERGVLSVETPWSSGVQSTGDIIEPVGEGFMLLGRSDRIIKIADKRVSLERMEGFFLKHPWVDDVFCSVPPGRKRIGACVALNEEGIDAYRSKGRAAVVSELKAYAAADNDATALPRHWRFVTALPRNDQGKMPAEALLPLWAERPRDVKWQCSQISSSSWRFHARVPLDLVYFSGHFDTFPLVPGVVEIQWISQAWRATGHPDADADITSLENVKFQHFLRPDDEAELFLEWLPEKRKLVYTLQAGDKTCAAGRMVAAGTGVPTI